MALELSPRQISTLERLVAAGLRPIAIPPYESALCMRKGECAVVLAPVPNAGLKVLAPASYLVDGNFGVREIAAARNINYVYAKRFKAAR